MMFSSSWCFIAVFGTVLGLAEFKQLGYLYEGMLGMLQLYLGVLAENMHKFD